MTNAEISFNRALGARIKAAQKIAGLTDADLAEKTGLSVSDIRAYQLGARSMRLYRLNVLALALEVSPNDLTGFQAIATAR